MSSAGRDSAVSRKRPLGPAHASAATHSGGAVEGPGSPKAKRRLFAAGPGSSSTVASAAAAAAEVNEQRWRADVHSVTRPRLTRQTTLSFEVRGRRLGQCPQEVTTRGPGAATRTPYKRGPAKLPPVPHPDNRPMIRPMAKKAWLVLSGTPKRTPASILGVLCRQWYPGLVQVSEEPVVRAPASKWELYRLATDDTYDNRQDRVLVEFWKYFKAEEGREAHANRAAFAACKRYVIEMHHQARFQAHIEYYRSILKQSLPKDEARRVTLTRDQYLQVVPSWCRSFPECWAMLVNKWLSPDFVETHEKKREQRLMKQGPTHHQGSRSLPAYKQAYEAAHPGEKVSEFSAWALSHMGKSSSSISFDPAAPPQAYSDPNVHTKVQKYTSAVRDIHGEAYNVCTEPIDPEAIMKLGGGKKHGRLYIANGAIDSTTVPSLNQIGAQSTSSSQPIRPRPSPALQQVQELQAELQETKRRSDEKNTELTARLEAQQKQMAEMMVVMQSLGQASGVPVQFSVPPLPPPAATLPPSAGSNHPANASPGDQAGPSH